MKTMIAALAACAAITPALAQTAAKLGGASPALVEELVTASRVLADQGVVDGFGHVSARHDRKAAHFLISRSMAPALVTAADIIEIGEDCEPVEKGGKAAFLERYIHCEVYRGRPEVRAVVHSHAPAVIPFTVSKEPLRALYHMSGFLGEGAPVFEIRDVAGAASDMLIRDRALGAALSRTLAANAVVLMRGHGMTAVGASLPHAVFRSVYTQVNARLQQDALRLGPVNYLTAAEAAKAAATNDGQVGRAWELWKLQAAQTATH
jgi:ribulose-5-phosphate 4-epimerase/fuculose-1-phosphate aldolase